MERRRGESRSIHAVKDLLKAIVVTLIIVSIYGFFARDRMRLTHIDSEKPKRFSLIVSMPDIDASYALLTVTGCAADVSEHGIYCLADGWASRSDQTLRGDKKSYEFPFPPPRGTVRFEAYATNYERKVVASAQLTLMRGF